jgi:AcrR family transcriptional regulator
VRAIVGAAIELADKNGLAALSMRQIADTLGVGTMSIYTHVPGRAELTALMFDNVLSQLYSDVEEPSRQPGWRAALELVAQRNWQVFTRHPWMLALYASRPSIGPQAMLKFEAELRALEGIGLGDVEMDSVLGLVITHVAGTAQVRADLQRIQEESGISDAEWWEQTEPVLLNLTGGRQQFPVAWRVGQAAGETHQASVDPEHMLRFGLERILDGVAQLVEARGPAGKPGTEARGPAGKAKGKASTPKRGGTKTPSKRSKLR